MLRFNGGVFNEHSIAVLGFLQDILAEAVRDKSNLQVSGITVICHRGVIHHIVSVERLRVALLPGYYEKHGFKKENEVILMGMELEV